MYGFIGYARRREAEPILIDDEQRLEYREHDSAEFVTVTGRERTHVCKRFGLIASPRPSPAGAPGTGMLV